MDFGWVAIADDDVEAALTDRSLRVRPPEEPIPKAMLGTRLGEIYRRLVRWNDGARHDELRAIVEQAVGAFDLHEAAEIAAGAARRLDARDVAGFTIASLIGIREPEHALPAIRDFAAAVAAGASAETIARGASAAEYLWERLSHVTAEDERANRLGFLFQGYAATARLIELTLHERTEPPVLGTRRFAAADVELNGTALKAGDAVMVMLASPRFHFGAGPHACPGKTLAQAIAAAAAGALRAT